MLFNVQEQSQTLPGYKYVRLVVPIDAELKSMFGRSYAMVLDVRANISSLMQRDDGQDGTAGGVATDLSEKGPEASYTVDAGHVALEGESGRLHLSPVMKSCDQTP